MSHYSDEREKHYNQPEQKSSPGLVALLIRNDIQPTYTRKKDIELARKILPRGYKD